MFLDNKKIKKGLFKALDFVAGRGFPAFCGTYPATGGANPCPAFAGYEPNELLPIHRSHRTP